MIKLTRIKRTLKIIAPRILATAMLFVFASQTLPVAVAATSDDSCQMACCKGLARHSKRFCSGGTCHFQTKKNNRAHKDQMCGAKKKAERVIAGGEKRQLNIFIGRTPGVPIFDESNEPDLHAKSNLPFLQNSNLQQSCETIALSAFGSQSFNQQNQFANDHAALIALSVRPRPPTTTKIEFLESVTVKFSRKIARQSAARAPPNSFSSI